MIVKKCSKIKTMDNILPDNEFVEIEGRQYLNPQTGLDESNAFIENLRATQGQQNQQIASDTYNLGTDIQSVQGGLGTNTPANMGYFTSRLQTPQTNPAVANLRAAAQAQALNEVLANEQAIWKKRYQDAYRDYQRKAYNRSRSGGGSGGGGTGSNNNDNTSTWGGEVGTEESPTRESYAIPGTDLSETDTHYVYTDQNTGEKVYVSKDYMKKIYDDDGNITDEGAVILDTRRLLGL